MTERKIGTGVDWSKDPETVAGAERAIARDRQNPGKYQPPETFDTLFAPDEKAFVLSGWGGVPAFPELEAEREAAGTSWLPES